MQVPPPEVTDAFSSILKNNIKVFKNPRKKSGLLGLTLGQVPCIFYSRLGSKLETSRMSGLCSHIFAQGNAEFALLYRGTPKPSSDVNI
jgi:hypothetical protein